MKALRLSVPIGRQETPASFTSRLAARNGLTAREFCRDWELRFQAVIDGDADATSIIAHLGGVDPEALAADAFVKTAPQTFEHRGERLVRHTLRRSRVHVCPACLLDDIRRSRELAPNVAAHDRAAWTIDAIRTCSVHDMGLAEVSHRISRRGAHDFVLQIDPALPRLEHLAKQAPRRQPTGLENYVMVRLGGARRSAFLDGLELYVAIRACEMIGAIAAFGRTPNLHRLTDDDWRRAGAAGFEIAAGGELAIEAFLTELQHSYPYGRGGHEGPQALFGRLYQWLEFGAADPAYDPVRAVIGRHIRRHLPVGAGDVVFGVPVVERTLHSIRTLASETGMHPKRLRKLLQAARIVGEGQTPRTDNIVVFDARPALRLVERARDALPLRAAGKYLNAPVVHVDILAKSTFIKPCVSAADFSANDQYARADLDDFLGRLFAGAHAVRRPKPDQVGIPAAAKRACCSAAVILRLILDRKLAWVGRVCGERGYLSVLVDVNEIRTKVRGADHGGLTKSEIIKRLRTTSAVVNALIEHGHLKAICAINPVNRCQQTVIRPEEFARFDREYVSLYALTQEWGKHFTVVRKALERRGVETAFDRENIGATFYRRSDCQQKT